MKLDIPDEYLPLIVTALEHYNAHTRAVQGEDPLPGGRRMIQAEACSGSRAAGGLAVNLGLPSG